MELEVIAHEPTVNPHPTPVLFVHGMWHAAWYWQEHFMPYFAQHGFRSYALSLRGHGTSEGGERLRWTPLSDYVADVAHIVSRLDAPPVLVGHSMGGMIVQKYLESHQAPAAVLLASAPPKGLLPATVRIAVRHPLLFLKVNLTLSLMHNVRTPQLYREAFFSAHLPEQELAAYHARVQNESFRAYLDMMALALPHPKRVHTPVLVLGTSDDNLIAPGEVRATAAAFNTDAEFFSGMGHAMMLDVGWQDVADRILGWLGDRGS